MLFNVKKIKVYLAAAAGAQVNVDMLWAVAVLQLYVGGFGNQQRL
jgi:hypothetical protein